MALFAAMALICAAIVSLSPKQDSALFFAAVPLFLICALIGLRRSERRAEAVEAHVPEAEEIA
jgi:hypothetical protein